MPTNTDLVTDLPADFEVFGQAVATSMADLLGGTTGQVLAKTSATDMDFTWTTPQVGDITGVTAGVGITGGGTSGTVTVTNDMATTITTAGDLIYGTGSGTYTRRGIGTTSQVLTVAGGVPTWATPAAAGGGLTFIKSQTIGTTVSSVTVTSAFSTTYDNYLITVNGGVGSTNGGTSGLLTLGSTTTDYYLSGQYMSYSASTVNGFNVNNGSSFNAVYLSTKGLSGIINLQNPFTAKETTFSSRLVGVGTGEFQANYAGWLNNTTSYTAFTITTSAGTMTGGEIRVYGYQNS